jgi:predicted ATPase/class 3 adenylate cyclase
VSGGLKQRLTAILAADVAGYTRLMAADAGATVAALDESRAVFRRHIEANRGRVIDMVGDSVLAVFDTAAGAVDAALAVQKALEAASASITEERRMRVRIGVHLGDVMEKPDGSVYGNGVNIAARLQAKAWPGGLCMSQSLYDSVKHGLPAAARFGGRQRLKHIEEPIPIWHIVPEGTAALGRYSAEALDAAPNNLPLQLTSFIGREGELAEVGRLLTQSRLLTLLGAGGIGKSRLSLEAAAEAIEDFEDGVWFVELATLQDARLVPQAVASVMGVKEAAGRPVSEALVRHFKDRRTLLILDNCEHLLQGCADLARQLLQAGPHAKILASSREPLRVAGETTYPVPALPENEAMRLFVDRAAKARPDFRVNGEATAIASVCKRLDGIPLAIELAAARVRALSVKAIDARLDDRFRLLTRGDQTALPRQQTLRALIDWSYDLLTEEERAVLRHLAVFAGGWTLEAAGAVAASGTVDEASVLNPLTQLVEKSLVTLDPSGERYRLLDTVRQYAQERLQQSGDETQARTRHLQFYVRLAEEARPKLRGAEQGEWLSRLDAERENLLTAHGWCDRAPMGADAGLRLAYLLRPYWMNRGLLDLGHRLTVEALMRSGAQVRNAARCRGLFDAGQLSVFMGRYAAALRYLEESLVIARELGDQRSVAVALQPLGMAHLGLGDLPAARRILEEALELAEGRGEQREIAAAGNQLAQLARVEGDLDRAEQLYTRVLAIMRQLEDRESIAIVLLNLAMVAIGRYDAERARVMLLEVSAIAEETRSKRLGQSLLDVSAGLAALRKDWERAACFYGAAEAQTAHTGLRRDPGDEAFLTPLVASSRDALGPAPFSAAEQAGSALSYEEVMAQTRGWLGAPYTS